MSVFGVNEFAARLPNALVGIATLVTLFQIGKNLKNTRFGLIWAGVYFGSILPFLYFKSGIIDPLFNLLIFLGLHYFIKGSWYHQKREPFLPPASAWKTMLISGFFIGLAMLTKGPVAFLVVAISLGVYWLFARFRFFVSPLHFVVFALMSVLTLGLWFGPETIKNGPWFMEAFIKYQYRLFSTPDAGHGGFPGYHFMVLLFGCFPASVFAVRAFFKMPGEVNAPLFKDYRLWMKILFWVVLILFTVVKSKIVHYSSLAYFPLTFLAAVVINDLLENKMVLSRGMKIGLAVIAFPFIAATFILPWLGRNTEVILENIDDAFARGNLEAAVNWTGWEVIPGVLLLAALVAFFMLWKKNQLKPALVVLFGGTAIFVFTMLIFFVGRVEAYSQRAAIEFFESKIGADCYVHNFAYKSYAQLFYTRKQEPANPESNDENWLLTGDIDKDVYFITKVHKAKYMPERDDIIKIGEQNGFVFYKREKK